MNSNDRLKLVIEKLKEIEQLRNGLNAMECDATLLAEADEKVWDMYLHFRQPERTPPERLMRAFQCLDEGFIEIAHDPDGGNAYAIHHESARGIALLLPKLLAMAEKLNIYPMRESFLADMYYWDHQEKDQGDKQ